MGPHAIVIICSRSGAKSIDEVERLSAVHSRLGLFGTELHLLVLGSLLGVPFATCSCDTGVITGLHLLAANRTGSYAQTLGLADVVVGGVVAGRGDRALLLPRRFPWGV
jgi:hypothetical protein